MRVSVAEWMNGPSTVLDLMAALGGEMIFISLGMSLLWIAASWRLFTKAGKPGWAALVPIYNIFVMLEITGMPLWWLILLFFPLVNLAISVVITLSLARAFGKSVLFGLGLFLLGIVFFPILAFGNARYQGPALASA